MAPASFGMRTGRAFWRLFDSLTDRVLCVIGAVLFSQGPEFMQQYLQRLGGHLGEARRQLAAFQNTASQSNLSLDRLISQTAANADAAVARLADVITDTVNRVSALQSAHDALLAAADWERPFVFLRHFDISIARATASIYRPAVPTTLEGLCYALAGMLFFLAVYHFGLKRLSAMVFARRAVTAKAVT